MFYITGKRKKFLPVRRVEAKVFAARIFIGREAGKAFYNYLNCDFSLTPNPSPEREGS